MVQRAREARAPEQARNIQVVTAQLDPPNVPWLTELGSLEEQSWSERLL
jgi:hypothetical protein